MQVIISAVIDGCFAAIAGLGFAYACNPPKKTLLISAILAAIAHALRYYLQQNSLGITSATFISAFSIGILGLIFAKKLRVPTEIITFPAILPMIPGMYAYRTILSIVSFSKENDTSMQSKLLVEITNNLLTTLSVALAIAVGITLSLLIFYEHSFMMTRKGFRGNKE